jgi:hypothetical protein
MQGDKQKPEQTVPNVPDMFAKWALSVAVFGMLRP